MIEFQVPPHQPFLGDRIEPIGDWSKSLPDSWVWGDIVGVGAKLVIADQNNQEFTASMAQLMMRQGTWRLWPTWVVDEIALIEQHERDADRQRSKFRRSLIPGEYIRINIGGRMVGAFVTKKVPAGFICSIPPEKALIKHAGVGTWLVSDEMLSWDDRANCWVARYPKTKA